MNLRIARDYEALSRNAAQIIAGEIRRKPDLVLGLAAGNTPLGAYLELVRMHREENLDFSRVVLFNLDEYGPGKIFVQRFSDFLHRNFVNQVNVDKPNVHFLSFPSVSVQGYCRSFEELILKAGGIDLQILGIGRNGHIAFNEPGSTLDSRTRVVTLDRSGVSDSPHTDTAISMGVATIMESHRILLLASGSSKAEVLAKALEGPVTETIPASFLQRHRDLIVLADEAASSQLKNLKLAG